MKKIIIILLVFLVSNCNSQTSSWIPVSVNGSGNINYLQFINNNIGWIMSYSKLLKTTNGGLNWNLILSTGTTQSGFSFINENTGWRADYYFNHIPFGNIYKTTNGGTNWLTQYSFNDIFEPVYFYSENIGYASSYYFTSNSGLNWSYYAYNGDFGVYQKLFVSNKCGYSVNAKIFRTTNTGTNWTILYDNNNNLYQFYSLAFLDSLNGFVSGKLNSSGAGIIFKTSNGGFNWTIINTNTESLKRISFINYNTGYAISNNKVYITTSSGINWTRQLCDTFYSFNQITFTDLTHGWIACNNNIILKTTNGGNVFVKNISTEIPLCISLSQNYPNPFNPSTNIRYQITNNRFVLIKIYDITGKEITTLVNEKQSPGTYEVKFDADNLPSGVYLYKLNAGDYSETKKMILLK